MSSMNKKVLATLASTISILGLAIVGAPAASAATAGAYGCSGTEIDTYPVKALDGTGSTWGTVHLYYNASTGSNCAVTVKSVYVGTPSFTAIYLNSSDGAVHDDDAGNYSYYAGPVSIHAPGRCISINGVVWNPAHTELAQQVAVGVHCG
ncbi:spore-associated protein A [Streptomyces sp. NPDC026672]|uniref:spore-associated protein A n=1 Tax=unclassified Streptomyces TaxID=2593676 RepID=UPI0033FCDD17